MREKNSILPLVYLKPGELFLSDAKSEPVRVKTVLGSCIAVTMFNLRLKMAGMCHALLPKCLEKGRCTIVCKEPFKYVNCVIPDMSQRFFRYGVKPKEIEVKLFGGADMFSQEKDKDRFQSVGRQNIDAAVEALQKQGLNLISSDVGGLSGRKIFFYTNTGDVWLKRLRG